MSAYAITSNGTTVVYGIDGNKIVHILGTGTWGGCELDVEVRNGNGSWTAHPEGSTKNSSFSATFRVPPEGGLRLNATSCSNTTNLWLQVGEFRS